MRTKTVTFAGKDYVVKERKIKELNELVDKIGVDVDGLMKANDINDAKNSITALLQDKLLIIFPGIKKEDIEEAYFSEIEELVGAFVDVNFFGIKKVITPLLSFAQKQSYSLPKS